MVKIEWGILKVYILSGVADNGISLVLVLVCTLSTECGFRVSVLAVGTVWRLHDFPMWKIKRQWTVCAAVACALTWQFA